MQTDRILAQLRPAEQKWLDSLKQWTATTDRQVLDLLRRIKVEFIGDERQLRERALFALRPTFGASAEDAWNKIVAFVADKDGVVDIHPETLMKMLSTLPDSANEETEPADSAQHNSFLVQIDEHGQIVGGKQPISDLITKVLLQCEQTGTLPGIEFEVAGLSQQECDEDAVQPTSNRERVSRQKEKQASKAKLAKIQRGASLLLDKVRAIEEDPDLIAEALSYYFE